MYSPSNHRVQFSLDWTPLIINGRMIFQIQVAGAAMEVPINLNQLNPAERQQLDEFMRRQQNQALTPYEVSRGIGWIWTRCLCKSIPA
jgi:hypothetical protein